MNSLIRALVSLSFIVSLLLSPIPAHQKVVTAQSINRIVLVAGDTIDLKWDPALFIGPEPFVRWELYRSKNDSTHYARITSGDDTSANYYRDRGLELYTTYYYQMRVVRCSAPCPENEHTYTVFSDSKRSGELWGTVYTSIAVSGEMLHTSMVTVPKDIILTIKPGTRLVGTGSILRADGGQLQINGGNFVNSVQIQFGIPGNTASTGSGWVRDAYFMGSPLSTITIDGKKRSIDVAGCTDPDVRVYGETSLTMKNNRSGWLKLYQKATANVETSKLYISMYDESSAMYNNNPALSLIQYGTSKTTVQNNQDGRITLFEQADAVIQSNPKLLSVYLNDDSTAVIIGNTISESIELEERARAQIESNQVGTYILVNGDGTSAEIVNNTIETASPSNGGIRVFDRSQTYIANNKLRFTAFHGTESAVLLLVVGKDAVSTVYGNTLTNCKMAFFDEAAVTVTDNLLQQAGSAIVVGRPFIGHAIEATGVIERNTLQSGWGFELWAGSHAVSYRHNCIQGNDPGATGADAVSNPMPNRVDLTQNWWGHPTGPTHNTNPSGLGDVINSNMIDFLPVDSTGATCRTAPPPLQPDLRIRGMEAVQVIQTLDNSVDLVKDKPTLLRIYPENRAGMLENVPWRLTATRAGSPVGQLNGTITTYPIADINTYRANRQAGIEIKLPPDWLYGTVDVLVELNPGHTIQETKYDNNNGSLAMIFTERKKLNIGLVPVTYAPPGQPAQTVPSETLAGITDPVLNMFPLAKVKPQVIFPKFTWSTKLGGTNDTVQEANGQKMLYDLELKLVLWNINLPADQRLDQIHAVIPGGSGYNIKFCLSRPRWSSGAYRGGAGLASYCWAEGMIMAHEIGHNLGLRHTQIGTDASCVSPDPGSYWPRYYPDDTIQEYGYNGLKDVTVSKTFKDMMSYCADKWISPLHYNMLFDANGVAPDAAAAPALADQPYLIMGGSVTQSGLVVFNPFWQVIAGAAPVSMPAGSEYCLEMRDQANALLQKQCFDLGFFGYESQVPLDTDYFLAALPYSAAVRKVVLTRNGVEIGSR